MNLTNKEIAQRILKAFEIYFGDIKHDKKSNLEKSFEEAFDNNPIYYIFYLASHWENDLNDWCNEQLGIQND